MASNNPPFGCEIIHLNVGGTRFSTSRQTLTWIPDSFFTSMLNSRISTFRDESGAIFIDRDPALFSVILNYLRTKDIDLRNVDLQALKNETEYYGITPLVKKLVLCDELEQSSCGDILFHSYLPPPNPPLHAAASLSSLEADTLRDTDNQSNRSKKRAHARAVSAAADFRPSSFRNNSLTYRSRAQTAVHSRNASMDIRQLGQGHDLERPEPVFSGHRNSDPQGAPHYRDLRNKIENHVLYGAPLTGPSVDPLQVTIVKAHHNWIAVSYSHFISIYRMKDSTGWYLAWTSPHIENIVERIAINAKVASPNQEHTNKMVAAASGYCVELWSLNDGGESRQIGVFDLTVCVDALFFIGSQLVGLSNTGKVGVWHAMTQHWQLQDVAPITSHDMAGSFLLLGCRDGCIYYIDVQKFPLRMKDNDLLVTQLFKDPSDDSVITALSVYLTPKTSLSGNWIEIAYGTSTGTIRVIVQHPETVGHGPQLFQTFTVHRSPVTKVMLSEKHLVSVCSEYNHVRTWSVTRFRGMISTQPGSMPVASYKIASLEDVDPLVSYNTGNDFGPYGERDEEQVFIQKVLSETDQLFVRFAADGKRVCVVKSVDGSTISAFCVHECEGSSRMGSRPRRYIFTGHTNGSIQMWDLTTALTHIKDESKTKDTPGCGGPTANELVRLLEQCDLSNSRSSTPCLSPAPSLLNNYNSLQRLRSTHSNASNHSHLSTSGAMGSSTGGAVGAPLPSCPFGPYNWLAPHGAPRVPYSSGSLPRSVPDMHCPLYRPQPVTAHHRPPRDRVAFPGQGHGQGRDITLSQQEQIAHNNVQQCDGEDSDVEVQSGLTSDIVTKF